MNDNNKTITFAKPSDQDIEIRRVLGVVYEALKDAGLYTEANMLAEKSERLFLLEWEKHRHIHENYSAVDGMGCSARQSDAFYHWGALLGYMAIDALR